MHIDSSNGLMQAISHYLIQCWSKPIISYCARRPKWVCMCWLHHKFIIGALQRYLPSHHSLQWWLGIINMYAQYHLMAGILEPLPIDIKCIGWFSSYVRLCNTTSCSVWSKISKWIILSHYLNVDHWWWTPQGSTSVSLQDGKAMLNIAKMIGHCIGC